MSRADKDPLQAEADMSRLQAEARQADLAQEAAVARAEALEREMDGTDDEDALERLTVQHQDAESQIEAAKQDFESVMTQIGNASSFWSEEDED